MTNLPAMGPATKQVIDGLTYEKTAVASQLMSDLQSIAALDRFAANKQGIFGWSIAGSLVAAFVCLLMHTYFAVLPILALIFLCSRFGYWTKLNVPDERHELGAKVVELVSRDSAPDSPILLEVDFSPTVAPRNRLNVIGNRKRDRSYYENQWLHIAGRFADGTKYSIRLTENSQVKFRKGKLKRKDTDVQLVLVYPSKRYDISDNVQKIAMGALKLPPGATCKSLRIAQNSLRISTKLDRSTQVNAASSYYFAITMMLLSAYQVLNLSKAVPKSS